VFNSAKPVFLAFGLLFFTVRRHASAVYAIIVSLCVCLSVRQSVTRRSSTKTAKRIGSRKQRLRYSSFWCWRYRRNSNAVAPNGSVKYRWGRV